MFESLYHKRQKKTSIKPVSGQETGFLTTEIALFDSPLAAIRLQVRHMPVNAATAI